MRARLAISGLVGAVLVAALIALASLPTGAATSRSVVPADARVAATERVGDARVLLLSQRGRLRLLVAYHRAKGWFGVPVTPAPQGTPAAWAATRGTDDIPALSATYGRVEAAEVRVRWADGRETATRPASDGVYLAVRRGRLQVRDVTLVAADGSTRSIGAP